MAVVRKKIFNPKPRALGSVIDDVLAAKKGEIAGLATLAAELPAPSPRAEAQSLVAPFRGCLELQRRVAVSAIGEFARAQRPIAAAIANVPAGEAETAAMTPQDRQAARQQAEARIRAGAIPDLQARLGNANLEVARTLANQLADALVAFDRSVDGY